MTHTKFSSLTDEELLKKMKQRQYDELTREITMRFETLMNIAEAARNCGTCGDGEEHF